MVISRRALATLAVVTLLLSIAGLAQAGVNADWRELGGSASTTGVSKTPTGNFSVSSSVAPGLDGRPVVAYSEESLSGNEDDGAIIVKRWTGAAWQTLSPVGGVGSRGFGTQIKIARNGTIYVAWLGATDGNVHLRRRTATGTVWEQLSGSDGPLGLTGFNTSLVRSFSLAVASDNSPLVAFTAPAQAGVSAGTDGILQGSYQAYVVQHTGTGWDYLGSSPFTPGGGGASNARSFSVDGGSFYAMHGVGFFGDGIRLAVDSANRPVVAFAYSTEYAAGAPVEFLPSGPNNTHRDLFATRWEANTSTWTSLGPEVPQSDDFNAGRGAPGGISVTSRDVSHFDLAAAPTGDRLYIAWSDDDFVLESAIYVRRFDGTDWEEVGTNSASGDGISGGGYHSSPTVAVDANSNGIVAWSRGGAVPVQQIFVLRSNGFNEWEEMGPDSASGDGISGNGPGAGGIRPWVAYFDGPSAALPDNTVVTWINFQSGQPSQVYLRQFTQGARFPLNVNVTGGGRVVSSPIGIDCPDDTCSALFPTGQVVSLTPIAGPDHLFDRFLGACTGGICNVLMNANRSVNASFVAAATLTVVKEGLGTVTAAGISCGSDCSEKYRLGTVVNLVVSMPTGTLFGGWGGACLFRGTNTSCPLTIGSNQTVTVDFYQRLYRLSVTVDNPASTVVNGVGGFLNASADGAALFTCDYDEGACTADVEHGQDVLLRTFEVGANRFVNYLGAPCAGRTNATCPFEMLANYSITSLLRGVTALLVNKFGNGANKSTVTGPGISCGNDCLGEAFTGTQVVITQTPGVGNRLVGFTGPCSGQTCSFLASGTNQSIDVTHQLNRHSLSVNGTGFGFTQSNPPGIDCGSVPGHFVCSETYDYGTVVGLTPFPGTDSRFISWTGCSRLNGTICLVDMTSNRATFKTFGPARTLFVSGSGNGRGVYSIPGQPNLVCQGNCSNSYLLPFNQPVVITPKPDTGSNFRWISGSGCPATGACTQLMSSNRTTVGEFRLNRHSIVVTNRLNGSVTSNIFPDSSLIDCGSGNNICTSEQDYNTLVSLQAVPDEGNVFVNWTGTSPCSAPGRATNSSCSVQLLGNYTYIPNFRAATVVDLFKDGNGQGSLAVTGTLSPAAPVCGPTCLSTRFTAFDSRPVILRATPSLGSRFVSYGGDCVSNSSTCTYIPGGANDSITATFVFQQFDLTVADRLNGTVTGTIPPSTGIIGCGFVGDDCSETLDFSTDVTLVAAPNADFLFISWAGDAVCAGKTTSTCSFKMPNRNVNVVPVYRARTFVSLLKDGNGQGTLTATGTLSPVAPVCGPTCSSTSFLAFDSKPVILRATPSLGSNFVAFQGDCASNSSTCTYIPSGANDTVTGTFVLQQFALNVTNRANGTVTGTTTVGTVIECGFGGIDCSETIDFSTDVVLGAVANPDFLFVSWAGDAVCAGKTTSTCSFKMPNRVVNVTPVYRARTFVTLLKDGNGQGSVAATGTLSPVAPVCGPTCSSTTFAALDGKPVTLRATPSLGSNFTAFLNDCASNTSTCTYIPGGANDTVIARFTLQQFALNVTDRPNGTVTGTSPSGFVIECGLGGDDCSETLDFSTDVTLLALPNADAVFVSWTGDAVCAGKTNNTCFFKMPNRVVNVTPVYRARTVVGLLKAGDGQGTLTATGTLSPVAPTCGPTCPGTIFLAFDSKPVTLRATPSIGSVFTGFTGDCGSNSSTCTYIPSGGNDTVTGSFTLQQFQLNVSNQANGNVDGPNGLDCGAGAIVCSVVQTFGDPVSLVADPADGYVFVNWTGDAACNGKTNSTCAFSMPNRNVTVTPNYRRESMVTVFPDGQGTVTGTGISCVSGLSGVTGDCSQTLTNGASLTLTATPATGWDFSFWDDPNCGSFNGSVCTITPVVDSVQVFPVFSREPRIATVLVSGNGSVVSGFDQCDNTSTPCQFSRQFGDTVILTATPAAGFDFFSWTGCQSTNGSVCTLQMTANLTATVVFLPTAAASITVGQGGLVFSAPSVTIAVGDTVRWTWATSNHNVVSGNHDTGAPDDIFCNPNDLNCATAPLVGPPATPTVYSHTFNSPGTFTYFCRQHRLSGMKGTITVE